MLFIGIKQIGLMKMFYTLQGEEITCSKQMRASFQPTATLQLLSYLLMARVREK